MRRVVVIAFVLACGLLTAGVPARAGEKSDGDHEQDRGLDLDFVRVDPGEYVRGFERDGRGEQRFKLAHMLSNAQDFSSEHPAHRVTITRPFEIARTEVTVGQFRAFVDATSHVTDAEKSGGALGWFPEEKDYVDRFHKDPTVTWRSPGFEQTEEHPVVGVSWRDAQAFCAWLSAASGREHRLPTEAEWEYACRAGAGTWYAWGEDPDAAYAHANVADGALEAAYTNTTRFQRAVRLGKDEGDGAVFTAPVGTYAPNGWGLLDMHGNVWEWCEDRWRADVYEMLHDGVPRHEWKDVVVKDPLFEERTEQHAYGDWRVLRGGAWTCAPAAVRASIRTYAEAGDAAIYTGFRVVRSVPEE